jgi:LmeA-like phospholipid-binding
MRGGGSSLASIGLVMVLAALQAACERQTYIEPRPSMRGPMPVAASRSSALPSERVCRRIGPSARRVRYPQRAKLAGMWRGGGGGKSRLAVYLAGAIILALAVAQLLLPRIAASVISSRVGRYGKVESASVTAWPAVRLLWGSVDSVRVRARSLAISPAQAAKLLWEAHGVASMDISAEDVKVGSLRLSAAHLRKRGSALSAQASATEADVQSALPAGVGLRLLRSEGGDVEVQASGGLFGVNASVNAVAQASEGKLVAHPLGLLVEGLRLTLFSDPHVYVEGVGASVASGQPPGYRLTMSASLR